MKSSRLRALFSLPVVLLLSGTALGCAATSKNMTPSSHAAIEATADAATVVFVRRSYYANTVAVTVLDEKGRFLGDSMAESYFAVKVPPGEHVFIAWSDIVSPLKANVSANHVYFVEVASKEGPFSPRMNLLAISSKGSKWGRIDEWLAASHPFAPDEASGQAALAARGADVEQTIGRAAQILSTYEPQELADRTLTVEDGK